MFCPLDPNRPSFLIPPDLPRGEAKETVDAENRLPRQGWGLSLPLEGEGRAGDHCGQGGWVRTSTHQYPWLREAASRAGYCPPPLNHLGPLSAALPLRPSRSARFPRRLALSAEGEPG
jgi:hypothetical protein